MTTGGRGVISYVHIWWGRLLLALGVINGGVGLQMAQERNSLVIAYSIVAAICFLGWFIVKGVKTFSAKKDGQHKQLNSPRQEQYEMPRRPYTKTREDRRNRPYV